MKIEISKENRQLIKHLADVTGRSISDITNAIIIYYRADKVVMEKHLYSGIFPEFSQNDKGITGQELHNILVEYLEKQLSLIIEKEFINRSMSEGDIAKMFKKQYEIMKAQYDSIYAAYQETIRANALT